MARDNASNRIPLPAMRLPSAEADTVGTPVPTNVTTAPSRRNILRPLTLVPHRLTPAERNRRITELAYRRAEQRNFASGNELEDWLDAEREVDAGRY